MRSRLAWTLFFALIGLILWHFLGMLAVFFVITVWAVRAAMWMGFGE